MREYAFMNAKHLDFTQANNISERLTKCSWGKNANINYRKNLFVIFALVKLKENVRLKGSLSLFVHWNKYCAELVNIIL